MIKHLLFVFRDKVSMKISVYFDQTVRIVLPPWRLLSVGTHIGFEILYKYGNF
jgi:hypothetical protein